MVHKRASAARLGRDVRRQRDAGEDFLIPHLIGAGHDGDLRDGEVNAPPYWGPTSWLVMGSGGMISTARDMVRWNHALRGGAILSEEWLPQYWAPSGALLDGGDMYGYEIRYNEGPGSHFVLVSNAIGFANRRPFDELATAICAGSVISGLLLSWQASAAFAISVPPGPAAVIVLALVYAASSLARRVQR